jgi:EmrB/QacA subfamily drug resistance transporter
MEGRSAITMTNERQTDLGSISLESLLFHALVQQEEQAPLMTPPSQITTDDTTIHDPRRRRRILIGVCIALMAVIASVSGLNVAQSQLAFALGASQSQVLWMINIYTITLAALLLPLGAAGDRWGRKRFLIVGLIVFGVASVAAGLAPNVDVMLTARFLSGIGAAMIMPVTLAIITSSFPVEERSRAIAVWTAVAGAGGIMGMLVSAVLVDVAGWRWLFVLPVVLVLSAIAIALGAIPNSREVSEHDFDLVGALTSMIAVVAFICVLNEGPELGWTTPRTLFSFLAGVAGAIAFVAWESHHQAPLLDIRLFGKRGLASGSLSLLAVFGVPTGVFVVLYPYFQAVLGWSGLRSTLACMPMIVLMIVCSGLAPRLADRFGARLAMATGVFLCGTGLALMALLVSVDGGYLSVLPGYLVMGLGMGLSMTPSTEAITSSLPREQQGVASALNDIAREFGSALGIALLGGVMNAGYRHAINTRLAGVPADAAFAARAGISGALAIAQDNRPYSKPLFRAAQESFVQGWRQAIWAGVIVMATVLVYVFVRGPERTNSLSSNEKTLHQPVAS